MLPALLAGGGARPLGALSRSEARQASIGCARVGPVKVGNIARGKQGEEVFEQVLQPPPAHARALPPRARGTARVSPARVSTHYISDIKYSVKMFIQGG